MTSKELSRRDVLRTTAAGAGVLAAGGVAPAFGQAAKPDRALPQGAAGTLTVIHRTEYFEQAQTIFRDVVSGFAQANGVKLDISTTNPESFGDFLGKMTAAVAARNPPDFAYTSNVSIAQMNLLGLVEDVTDVVDEAVRRYGNIMPGINAPANGRLDGGWKAVPFIASATGHFIRGDKLKDKGIDPAGLKTYEQRRAAALAISDPGSQFWGWGLTANQSGDGYGFVISAIQAFGGHYTDETGLKVRFNSPETIKAVEWLAETYDRKGRFGPMLPPGIESWGDISNNEAFLAGSIGYTHNAFSLYAQAKRDNNPVFPNIVLLPAPTFNDGRRRDGGNVTGWLTVFKNAPNKDLAKKLCLHMLDPANFTQISKVAGGLFNPAYESLWTEELLAQDPNFRIIKEQVSVTDPFIGPSWPAKPNAAIDAIRAQGVTEQMVANVVAGRMNAARAVKDAHDKIVNIFEEGGIRQG
jgi:multiple sugar transport system substrate-binding protein